MPEQLPIKATELLDLALVWLMVWAGIAWLRTNPARLGLAGLAVLAAVYLGARQLGLVLTTWILQGFAAVSVLVAVVVFQQELRRLFEQIGTFGPLRRRASQTSLDATDSLVRSLSNLVQQGRGALVVIPGREPLDRHLDGGVLLDARLSEPLLLSLFDPHSPGHDGAVLVEADRVTRFAVHLPLSSDHAQLGTRGTRHAAALGLSERADALCIVVSEERGTVSVAQGGRLVTLPSAQAAGERVRRFLQELSPEGAGRRRPWAGVAGRWREALLALPLAAGLWALAVPGASVTEGEEQVPIQVSGLPKGYVLERVEPETAQVRVAGRRRDLLLLDPTNLGVKVDAILVELGRRSFALSVENVRHPDNVEVRGVQPDSVKIHIRKDPPPGTAPKP